MSAVGVFGILRVLFLKFCFGLFFRNQVQSPKVFKNHSFGKTFVSDFVLDYYIWYTHNKIIVFESIVCV